MIIDTDASDKSANVFSKTLLYTLTNFVLKRSKRFGRFFIINYFSTFQLFARVLLDQLLWTENFAAGGRNKIHFFGLL